VQARQSALSTGSWCTKSLPERPGLVAACLSWAAARRRDSPERRTLGGLAERTNASVLKTEAALAGRRGFESHALFYETVREMRFHIRLVPPIGVQDAQRISHRPTWVVRLLWLPGHEGWRGHLAGVVGAGVRTAVTLSGVFQSAGNLVLAQVMWVRSLPPELMELQWHWQQDPSSMYLFRTWNSSYERWTWYASNNGYANYARIPFHWCVI
jgi:hypothetical protein